jgi:hypothetical protein
VTRPLQFHSRVGKDGVLQLRIPLSPTEAGAEVVVTVQSLPSVTGRAARSKDWHTFLNQTYGSCADLDLERGDQGVPEQREEIE